MTASQLFDLWAPPQVVWSRWAKPVLFAELNVPHFGNVPDEPTAPMSLPLSPKRAIIVDLPSSGSVQAGLALVSAGFRPVPLFNGSRGPQVFASALVDNDAILLSLIKGASVLERHSLDGGAPPAFLLDSRRRPQVIPQPGRYDNRWIVFPQDFPSANFLKSQGIVQAMLIQENPDAPPQEDLAHVLKRWQEGGLEIYVADLQSLQNPQLLQIQKPSQFRWLWYALLALVGLRRNSAGGFGSVVPQPSSGG